MEIRKDAGTEEICRHDTPFRFAQVTQIFNCGQHSSPRRNQQYHPEKKLQHVDRDFRDGPHVLAWGQRANRFSAASHPGIPFYTACVGGQLTSDRACHKGANPPRARSSRCFRSGISRHLFRHRRESPNRSASVVTCFPRSTHVRHRPQSARCTQGMSQSQIARELGLDHKTCGKWRRNQGWAAASRWRRLSGAADGKCATILLHSMHWSSFYIAGDFCYRCSPSLSIFSRSW